MSRDKKKSIIEEVKVGEATYEDKPQKFTPTFINFFFGKNGSGKSTIARVINKKTTVTWQDNQNPDDYTILLYDADFISDNFNIHSDLPGVFSVNKGNIEIEKKITEQQNIVKNADKEIDELESQRKTADKDIKSAFDKLKSICWTKFKEEEAKFPEAPIAARSKDTFAQTLVDIKDPAPYDFETLKTKYNAAFDEASHAHELFKAVKPISLKSIPGFSICGTIITSSSQNPFNEFIQSLGALKWVQDGHARFAEKAGDLCPYCHQTLPKKFEADLASCFDQKYEQNMRILTDFSSHYKQEAENIIAIIERNTDNPAPFLDLEQYNILLDNLRKTHEINMQKLETKKADPASTIELDVLDDIIKKISDIIAKFNAAIMSNNKIVNDRKTSQTQCGEEIRRHIAHELKTEIEKYRADKKAFETTITKLGDSIRTKQSALDAAKAEISNLSKQVVNTKESMENINALLESTGFQGFRIREKAGKANAYEIIYDNGKSADRLSEGERNFIMFLYFYQQVRGSKQSQDALKDKIVIIDDPVTSMDTGSVFVVSSLVRNMIDVCRHNVDWSEEHRDDYKIRQIFIMTHNSYFHRSITYEMDDRKLFDCVSFFLVRKDESNQSYIDPCVQDSKVLAGTKENYNPVKDNYEALWDDYQNAVSPTPLLNVMRQIMETYFLQTCSYSIEHMLEEISQPNRFVKEDGSEDKTARQLATNMLRQLESGSRGLSSGIEYAENAEDAQAVAMYRNIFRQMFCALRQEQHYDCKTGGKA